MVIEVQLDSPEQAAMLLAERMGVSEADMLELQEMFCDSDLGK